MSPLHNEEVAAHLDRTEESLRAARELYTKGYYDVAASRCYYAAFYAAAAALLAEGVERGKANAGAAAGQLTEGAFRQASSSPV